MDISALSELGETIATTLSSEVISTEIDRGELMVNVRPEHIAAVLRNLRDDQRCLFKLLVDVTAVDHPEREERFDIVYNLLSVSYNLRVRVKLKVAEDQLVPSVCGIFKSAGWYEREVWDLYGVMFADHPDLRRIMTDYGFEGHPLRKDFPLSGFVEVRYDAEQKRVVYEPVKMAQEFRRFDFLSPWEGARYVLPGDEKAEGQEPA